MTEKVSIIMPAFNAELFLSESIESALNQSYQNIELIIINDRSSDNTKEIIEEYKKLDPRIIYLENNDASGAAHTRNLGIRTATGRFIAFLDSDDVWCPEKLAIQIDFMLRNNYKFTFTAYDKINEKNDFLFNVPVPSKINYKSLLKTCVIGCSTVIYDKNKLNNFSMPTNTKREDFAGWLRILKEIDYANGINIPLSKYRVYRNQSSSKKWLMAKENWKIYRELEKINPIKSFYLFSHYAIKGLLRNKFPKFAKKIGVL